MEAYWVWKKDEAQRNGKIMISMEINLYVIGLVRAIEEQTFLILLMVMKFQLLTLEHVLKIMSSMNWHKNLNKTEYNLLLNLISDFKDKEGNKKLCFSKIQAIIILNLNLWQILIIYLKNKETIELYLNLFINFFIFKITILICILNIIYKNKNY